MSMHQILGDLAGAIATVGAWFSSRLAAAAVGAVLGTQLGIHRWPVHRLRKSLALVLLIAAGKLLFA